MEKSWYEPKLQYCETFRNLSRLRKDSLLCDVVIKVGNKKFHAHKNVLAASCPYFEAMFLSGMVESHQQEVTLQEIDADSFEAIVGMIYDGQICITTENVQSVLVTASIFHIDHLKQACSDFLQKHLTPHNSLGIKSFAEAHGCGKLRQAALHHVLLHFDKVSSTEEFLKLGLDQVMELLGREDLKVESEEQIFDAAVQWIEHDSKNRSKCIAKLLSLVRLPLLSPQLLADKVKINPLVCQSIECRDLVDEALILYHLLPERRGMIPSYKLQERKCLVNTGVIYAVGGLSSQEGSLSSVERFDSSRGKWEISRPMLSLRSRFGVAAVEGLLYTFGGYDGTSRLQTVECFDPKEDRWLTKKPMTTRRSALAIAVYGKKVYIIGGYDGNASLSTVEVGNMEELLPILLSAKEKGLKLTLHLSEIPGRNAETTMLLGCNPDRIGHGTFLHPKVGGTHEIIDIVSSKKIPIEICLTSNLKVETVASYDVHHLGYWYFKKHPLIICTDDKGVFSTSLSEEYSIAAQTFSLSTIDLFELSSLAVDYIFDEEIKQDLRKFWI